MNIKLEERLIPIVCKRCGVMYGVPQNIATPNIDSVLNSARFNNMLKCCDNPDYRFWFGDIRIIGKKDIPRIPDKVYALFLL